jgi:NAD-dependent dihydropyrimidine dehydrogenase PreA subunit
MIERIDDQKCNGCAICFQICPGDVFRIDPEQGRARIAYREDCQTCFSCELDCPEAAIYVSPIRRPRVQVW